MPTRPHALWQRPDLAVMLVDAGMASWTIWARVRRTTEKPPPRREVVRVPVDDEGREIQAG